MSFDLNRFQLLGRVVEIRDFPRSTIVKIATVRTWRDADGQTKQHTDFVPVVILRRNVREFVTTYVHSGDTVGVEGHIEGRRSLPGQEPAAQDMIELIATRFGKLASSKARKADKIHA